MREQLLPKQPLLKRLKQNRLQPLEQIPRVQKQMQSRG